jgi:hypothetical protein
MMPNSSVEFEEDPSSLRQLPQAPEEQPVVKTFIKLGIAKNSRQVNVILLILFILINGATIFLVQKALFPRTKATFIEDVPPEVLKTLPPELIKDLPSRTKR